MQKPEAFHELLKLIFCKIEDERSAAEKLQFYVSENERMTMNGQGGVKARISRLFAGQVLQKYQTIFKPNETIEMDARVVSYVVSELQHYSLLSTSVDVKGLAYEEIVGSNLRGDRGEFFTPRNACKMAVKMIAPEPDESVLDPACGTGGFLVSAMHYVLEQIESTERRKWYDFARPTSYELDELYRKKTEYLSNRVFGLDLNPALVRAAKMNMVMNNDGSGNLHQCNSLEHPHRWSPQIRKNLALGMIDVVFANPPFGSNIPIDDPAILAQYDVAAQWDKDQQGAWSIRIDTDGERILQSSMPPEILFVERCLQFLKPGTGRMAIVLPNGLLNNPGLEYFRYWLLSKAQVLAVVDMHRDLFQPHNDTQTSMVLLRRRAAHEPVADYPLFMAIADSIGHNKRGAIVYQRNPDGTLVIETRTVKQTRVINGIEQVHDVIINSPVIDDELDDCAEEYLKWLYSVASHTAVERSKRG